MTVIFPLDSWGRWNEGFNKLTKVSANERSGCASRLNYLAGPGPKISLSTVNYFDFLEASIVNWQS